MQARRLITVLVSGFLVGSDAEKQEAARLSLLPGGGLPGGGVPGGGLLLPSMGGPVQLVVLLTATRSASTSISNNIAEASCSINFNEFFEHSSYPQGTAADELDSIVADYPCQYVSGGCDGDIWARRSTNMTQVLEEARSGFCTRAHAADKAPSAACDAQCVAVVKIHGDTSLMRVPSGKATSPQRESLIHLINQSTTRVVVTERHDIAARECSYNYSRATWDWHDGQNPSGPDDDPAKAAWEAAHCEPVASKAFAAEQREWYGWVAATLDRLQLAYLTMPYEVYVGDATTASTELRSFAGLA